MLKSETSVSFELRSGPTEHFEERDFSIRFTNTILEGYNLPLEDGYGQHGRPGYDALTGKTMPAGYPQIFPRPLYTGVAGDELPTAPEMNNGQVITVK